MSGDARLALDICRRATELASLAHKSKSSKSRGGAATVSHSTRAVQELFSSPKIVAIRSVLC